MERFLLLPRVYPIIDTASLERCGGLSPVSFAAALLEGGAKLIQFRHKGFFGATAFDLARQIHKLAAEAGAALIINDRADVAKLLGCGVHLGQEDLAPADARIVLGDAVAIGYSTHNAAQLQAGDRQPVHYLAIGPIFTTSSKERLDPVVGLDGLRTVRALTAKPLVAIGGISETQAQAVWAAGADTIALISGLIPSPLQPASVRRRMELWRKLGEQAAGMV